MSWTSKFIDISVRMARTVVNMEELVRVDMLKKCHGIWMSMYEDYVSKDITFTEYSDGHLMPIARRIYRHRGIMLVERLNKTDSTRNGTRSKTSLGAHDIPDSILDGIVKESAIRGYMRHSVWIPRGKPLGTVADRY